ncbi:type IV pilus twitching motility protein PilT [Jatrophihabitans telluris]|uniref:Type IV pilus twitching motility protein PilT n=1 Tax=Jatrophihabitans telluris TaxID=2038343 RepID=A0ABY4R309_9ACTN|nr:type IV pilus twitching motility protein PilT [Jatrophihabitans telluris]UQX89551.1 type IV pilus twitching motility protein PilT [Jatrophihabitans telluris]
MSSQPSSLPNQTARPSVVTALPTPASTPKPEDVFGVSALSSVEPMPAEGAKEHMELLLRTLVTMGGSDLHMTAGIAPAIRVHGSLAPLEGHKRLNPEDTENLISSILTPEQWQKFLNVQELDTSYAIPSVSRFRVNVYRQRGAVGAAFRTIPHHIRNLADLGLPDSIENFAHLPRGLVLVTGPTGSGKSTTLASLLDVANRTRAGHIMTIEDPIEYLHTHGRCVVNQREVGADTEDFAVALKHVLRQDPDIILVGELRDLETTSVAVTAAETGHLVLATLHTQSAAQTVDRLIDIYPPHQQQQIRAQLANCLQGVVTQALVPRKDGTGRTIVCEIMVASAAIRNLIREGKAHQIPSFLQSSSDQGMISFDQHLAQRYAEQLIAKSTALELAHDPNEFKRLARI